MGLAELPAQYEYTKSKSEEIRMEQSAGKKLSLDSIYLLANKPDNSKHDLMSTDIENLGAVEKMKLPAGWSKGEQRSGIGGLGHSQQFLLSDSKDTELTVFERGRRYESNASAFKSILAQPPHTLSAAEKEALGPILGNYGDPRAFAMASCKTEDLNGKKVLLIEGSWQELGHRSYSLINNPDGEGQTVQEIFFKAPAKKYELYLPLAKQSIKSIQWK